MAQIRLHMQRSNWIVTMVVIGALAGTFSVPAVLRASVSAQAARDAAEYVLEKFGQNAVKEGAEKLAVRIERAAVTHGDEVVAAVRKAGPRALQLAEKEGAKNGGAVVRIAARYGDEGLWIVEKPDTFALVIKHGDEAADAILKHPGIAEGMIEAHGKAAAEALGKLSSENAKRLAMMGQADELAKLGRTDEVLATVGKYGDRAMDFVWKHKAALATAAVLATFLADPQPYLDGVKDITQVGIEKIAAPIAEVPGEVAREAARATNWTPVMLTIVGVAGALAGLWLVWPRRVVKAA